MFCITKNIKRINLKLNNVYIFFLSYLKRVCVKYARRDIFAREISVTQIHFCIG